MELARPELVSRCRTTKSSRSGTMVGAWAPARATSCTCWTFLNEAASTFAGRPWIENSRTLLETPPTPSPQ